jgi:membrane protein implicated in regulation of membrane protease activity
MPWIEQPSHQGDDRPGCMDALILTRMAFGILFWPMLAVIAAGAGITLAILLLATYPLPTIAGAVALAVAAAAAWRWVSGRRRPPDA